MQTLLIIMAVVVFIIGALVFLFISGAVKLARAAKPALKQEIEKAREVVNHPVVGDDARDLLKRAAELAEQVPDPGFFTFKRTYKALAEATSALVQALEKAQEYRRNHTLAAIGEAERHVEIVADSIRREFGVEPSMAVSQTLLADANRLAFENQYDAAEGKAMLAIDAANAEYARVRSTAAPKSGSPAPVLPEDKLN
jgi:hypothetical protein